MAFRLLRRLVVAHPLIKPIHSLSVFAFICRVCAVGVHQENGMEPQTSITKMTKYLPEEPLALTLTAEISLYSVSLILKIKHTHFLRSFFKNSTNNSEFTAIESPNRTPTRFFQLIRVRSQHSSALSNFLTS